VDLFRRFCRLKGMGLRRAAQGTPQSRLPFEYETTPDEGTVTAYGGLPLIVDTMRSLKITDAVREHVCLGKRSREFDEASLVEGFVLLMAAGGECLDDFRVLGEDRALCRLLEHKFPSPETARKFLYAFHDEALIEAARAALPTGEVAFVPAENALLRGLGKVNVAAVRAVAARGRAKIATVDGDATIQESHKREAKAHYKGGRGYQPVAMLWAEQDLVLADEFRDGNVPAGKDTLRATQRAFEALPDTVTERRFRGDSAFYNEAQLKWLSAQGIEFTISADMSRELRAVCERVPEAEWKRFEERPHETVHVTEVEFFPGDWKKDASALRYLALRFTPRQGKLFDEGAGPKYLAVVTNRSLAVETLVRWHWEKSGTIERLHDVTKNELGAGVLPCGRFGANAAWYRLAMLTYNVLSALRSIALPPSLSEARPKRLRFQVFVIPAIVIQHARRLVARLIDRAGRAADAVAARVRLWQPLVT